MSWFRKAKDKPEKEPADPEVDLVPSLAEVVWRNGLDRNTLTVAVPMDGPGTIGIKDRQLIWVDDSQQTSAWQVTSLRELFRGDRQPPADAAMDQYPAETLWFFAHIESHLVTLCDELEHDPTDDTMLEIYTTLRRRPDGRSLGPLHDAVWQLACLAVGSRPVSAAEFDAFLRRLARSARTFRMGDSSRNYLTQIRRRFDEEED